MRALAWTGVGSNEDSGKVPAEALLQTILTVTEILSCTVPKLAFPKGCEAEGSFERFVPLLQSLRKQAADDVQRLKKQQKEESDAAARTLCGEMGDE